MLETLNKFRIAKHRLFLNLIFLLLSLCIVNTPSAEQKELEDFPWELFYPAVIGNPNSCITVDHSLNYTLNVVVYGVWRVPVYATGKVTSGDNPPRINECANKYPYGTCEAVYAACTVVTLTATPNKGFFAGPWMGNDYCDKVWGDSSERHCKVIMNSDKQITGTFDSIQP